MYLNCHTYYSFKFGTMSIEGLLKEAVLHGADKFVLSDINNTSAILETHRLCHDYPEKYPLQPIAGIDFRNGIRQQFIGIAKNDRGFFELNNFLSAWLREGGQGLTGRDAKIPARAPAFQNVQVVYPFAGLSFDPLNREPLRPYEYIGIKPSELNRLRFSPWKHHTEKLVVLAPVTFRNKVDFNAHRLLRAMDNNIVLSKLLPEQQARQEEVMMDEHELAAWYHDFPALIHQTKKLLEECEPIDFDFGGNKNKKYFLGSVQEDREKLIQLCEEGMVKRYPEPGEKIRERYQREIDVISKKDFSAYFLINHDIVQFARRRNFFYVGRGSGANSMVAYLLYITDVDPIQLDLYFERFINPSRKNPPDFDIDFSSDERDEVIKHIFKTHGAEHTALLATYSEMKDDSLLRELGKVFGLPKAEIDALQAYGGVSQAPDHITQLIYQYKGVLKTFPSHLSIHAGGILIAEKPITCFTALSNPPKGFPLTQFSMQEAEDVGFAKFDILSQRGLGKVRDAVDIIRKNQGDHIDIHEVERFKNDEAVRENLKHAKLMGCFYVESPAMRMLLTKLKASTYLDLVAASSIIRPGVAQSGMMQEYIRRFHEPDHGKSRAIPELWTIMEETFGVMVYQEDVIKVAYSFGGFTLEEADKLRRGMGGKYRGRQEFLEVKDKFFANCRKTGKDEKLINEVWFQMETFGGYAFAKGHSASYAVESYQCMFLKTHYPLEYMVAVINNGGGFFGQQFYIHEARMCGARIHAPDINSSGLLTTIRGKDIYLGLNFIAESESELKAKIISERELNGAFSSLENFMRRVSVSVDQLRILIRIGAFRFTGRTKKELLWDIHSILGHQKRSTARRELFEGENKKYLLPELFNDEFEDARDENEILGFPLSSPFSLVKQPLPSSLVAADFKKHKGEIIEIVGYYVTRKPTSTKKGEAMMFGCFLDREGAFFDTNHFPEATSRFPFRGAGCYLVKGKVAEEFGFYSINVLTMQKLDYVMYEEDAEERARAVPDPVIVPPVVPASRQYEYLLIISPPPHVRDEVMLIKRKFHQQFDHYLAVVTKPHITLFDLKDSENKEAELIKQVSAITSHHPPLKISLRDFDVFPPHTLYIKIEDPDPVTDIVRELEKAIKPSYKYSRFIKNPNVSVARQLDKEKFSRASAEFCGREYAVSFVAAAIVLLRKEIAVAHSKYEMVREFRLEGKQLKHTPLKKGAWQNSRTGQLSHPAVFTNPSFNHLASPSVKK